MSERPFSSTLQAAVVKFLQDRCHMRVAKLNPEIGFTFDVLLVGPDPLNVVVVEAKQTANQHTLKAVARKVQSFAWSLHAQQKHNLVTLILITPALQSLETTRLTLKELNGSARVFLVSESATQEQIENELSPLAAPAFALGQRQAVGFEQLQNLVEGIEAKPILELTASSSSDDELKSKLIERLEILSAEVQSALKKPGNR
jgi:CheY-like chemotaxis protein